MKDPKVAVIDYEMCNLFSVKHACLKVGLEPLITRDPAEIASADAVILPGVGAFGDAMENLRRLELIPMLREAAATKPFMGICLGLQLLFSESCEFGDHAGIGLIEGTVRKFPETRNGRRVKVPQIGWNRISFDPYAPIFAGIPQESYFYFVHSYYGDPAQECDVLSMTDYEGVSYCSAVQKGLVIAFQFHPEKSAELGLRIYQNWKTMIQQGKV